jgi:hypothetical protein
MNSDTQSEGARELESRAVWLIEDNHGDAKRYKRLFERAGAIQIHIGEVRNNLAEYAGLAGDPTVGAVIVDQNLGEFSGVGYFGLDVARYLRAISGALPVFILTNFFEGDLEENGEAVDLIIRKEDVRKLGSVYVARILRRMGDYERALSGQLKRYRTLIDREFEGGLSADEKLELQALEHEIDRPYGPTILAQEEREAIVAEIEERRLTGLRELVTRLEALEKAEQE